MKPERTRPNRNRLNLSLDITIFVAFLVSTAPRLTGITIHEWLGIAFGAAIVTHLVLHWQWIAGVTRRLFGRAQWRSRVNYLLNALLFVDVTLIVFTGLMISEAALPLFGVRMPRDGLWAQLHHQTSDLAVFLTALHIALHWSWIVNSVRRYLLAPLWPGRRAEVRSSR